MNERRLWRLRHAEMGLCPICWHTWYYEFRKEVKKEVAIDYKKEWEKLRHWHGLDAVSSRDSLRISALSELMDSQIKNTIQEREKLMQEYVRTRVQTEIIGGTKNSHVVNVIIRGRLFGGVSVLKEEFQNWIKNRKEEK